MALGGSTLLTPGSFNVQAVSGSTPAAWQCGLLQAIQGGAVRVGSLLVPRCVAVAPAAWQWPIKRMTDVFLAGTPVTP